MKENRKTDPKDAVIEELADIIERRDNTESGHVFRIKNAMLIFAKAVADSGLYKEQTSNWDAEQISLSSTLHDIGKGEIDDMILRKPGKLSDIEFEVVKKHTLLGGEIIQEIRDVAGDSKFLDDAYNIAMYHHEKWDGSGYPKCFLDVEIPLVARLMAIIDVYDALVSERPYKQPFTHEEAIKIIADSKGTSFDPDLLDIFIKIADQLSQEPQSI